MPRPGTRWRHVIINTKNTWLPGDQRGFCNRNRRIHSSGDYKSPPPKGEHANLHAYFKPKINNEVTIPEGQLRATIGQAILKAFIELGYRVIAIAVGKVHAHILVELPNEMPAVRRIVGEVKRVSSRAVKKQMPGTVWSEGLQPEPVDDPKHQHCAHDYIIYDQGASAWTWSYEDSDQQGRFGRKRTRKKNPRRRQRSAPA